MGVEALHLLCSGNIAALADRFGYALAYDREPATAIKDDLRFCLEQLGSSSLELPLDPASKVEYFKPNDTGLLAVVECLARTKYRWVANYHNFVCNESPKIDKDMRIRPSELVESPMRLIRL